MSGLVWFHENAVGCVENIKFDEYSRGHGEGAKDLRPCGRDAAHPEHLCGRFHLEGASLNVGGRCLDWCGFMKML